MDHDADGVVCSAGELHRRVGTTGGGTFHRSAPAGR
jgi:hypothetical protein